MNDICIPGKYCTIYFRKSKTGTIEFSAPKGVFFVQIGTKKLFSLIFAFSAAWLAVRFLLPLVYPFLFGALLALAAEPAVRLLCRRLHLPRAAGAGIGVSVTFLLLCILLLMLCAYILRELGRLTGYLPDITATVQNSISVLRAWLLLLSGKMPRSIQPLLQENIHALFSSGTALVDRTVRYILGLAGNLLSHVPNSALSVGTAVLSAFMISAKLPGLRRGLLQRIPEQRLTRLKALTVRLGRAASGWLRAQAKLMGVTFGILLIGFSLLRIRHPLAWAAGTAAVDAFPVLGTGTLLLPWSILSLLQGDTARGVGLLGIYVTVSLVRSALEPRLLGRQLGLDPLVTLMALYAGFQLWGIGGMLLAPLITVTAMQILPERKEE